jgi:hypothetical protein
MFWRARIPQLFRRPCVTQSTLPPGTNPGITRQSQIRQPKQFLMVQRAHVEYVDSTTRSVRQRCGMHPVNTTASGQKLRDELGARSPRLCASSES